MSLSITLNLQDKYCPSCNKTKPIEEFHKNIYSRDNHTRCCKSCNNNNSKMNRLSKVINEFNHKTKLEQKETVANDAE